MIFDLPSNINFQNPASPIAEGIIDLHHYIFHYLLGILVFVCWMSFRILQNSSYNWTFATKENFIFRKAYLQMNTLVHGTVLEIVWTLIPSLILVFIAFPSFALLYALDIVIDPKYTIKVIGHQWYWTYETPFQSSIDSYMIPTAELETGSLRLLDVDNALFCPLNVHLRFLVTATDVLHAFAVPSLGIKVDAVPGRLNQVSAYITRPGIFYGQCSELCGVNHGFMPIKIISY